MSSEEQVVTRRLAHVFFLLAGDMKNNDPLLFEQEPSIYHQTASLNRRTETVSQAMDNKKVADPT